MTLVKYELYDDLFLNNKKENLYFLNRDTFVEFTPNIYNILDNIKNDSFAQFCFVYDGNMLRYTKKVEKIGEIFSYLGNFFNIMLTFFRIINNYFSNKILFIDIFYTFFFEDRFKKKDKIVRFDDSKLFFLFNKNSNQSKLNLKTQEKSINSNINLNSFIQQDKNLENNINKNSCLSPKNNNKNGLRRILTNKSKIIEKEKKVFKKDSKLYFFCPLWVIKSKKNLNHLLTIKESICNSFSLENFLELLKLKKSINNFQRERNQNFNEQKNNLSDKNVRRQINQILNDK